MATQFNPVELATIKQGEFIAACQEAFVEAQQRLLEHVDKHGQTATATVAMKVDIKYDADKESYAILSDVQVKAPKKPSQVTTAFVSEDPATEKQCLFAPAGGSTADNPRQTIMHDGGGAPIGP
jgi:hypothetical protein